MYLFGVVLMLVNLFMTTRRAPKELPDPAVAVPRRVAAGGDGQRGDGQSGAVPAVA